MNRLMLQYNTKLVFIFSIALILLFLVEFVFTKREERKDFAKMKKAIALTQYWFNCVDQMKKERKVISNVKARTRYSPLIGDEFTDITTTLGSLEAKEISTNPEFAALIESFLIDCEIDSTKTVGLMLSGSFPALSISSLAAIQTLNAKAVIFSSLGASMYGANQPGAIWLDIEKYLQKNGNLRYQSSLVSIGAENDNGGGLSEEGIQILKSAASDYNVELYLPISLKESIEKKVDILLRNNIDILINIGGTQTSLGACIHSLDIPNGLHREFTSCSDKDRGVIAHIAEEGIPFINLLNIKNLAIENDMSVNPSVSTSSSIYWEHKTNKIAVVFSLIFISVLIALNRKKNKL